jgi:hypothetical protein
LIVNGFNLLVQRLYTALVQLLKWPTHLWLLSISLTIGNLIAN